MVKDLSEPLAEFARDAAKLEKDLKRKFHNARVDVVVREGGVCLRASAWEDFGWVKLDAEHAISWVDLHGTCANLSAFACGMVKSELKRAQVAHREGVNAWTKAIAEGGK